MGKGKDVLLPPLDEHREQATFNEEVLKEVTRKLMAPRRPKCTESVASYSPRGSSKYSDFRYTKFAIGGIPGEKHAIFLRDSMNFTADALAKVCTALGREPPSLLLCGKGGLVHPGSMCGPQLRACADFRPLVADAKSSLGLQHEAPAAGLCRPCCGPTESELLTPEDSEGPVAEVVSSVFEKKLVGTVAAVMDAASRAKAWTLTGPRLSSFELLLQQCIESGDVDDSVVRLVVAHLQDRAYLEAEPSRALLKQLFENSQAMSANCVESMPPVVLPGDLWNPAKNTANAEFKENGFSKWSFDSYDDPKLKGHPISQWPWQHGDLYLFYYREEVFTGEEAAADVDWEFSTRLRLDQKAIPLVPDVLAPLGHVFIGGSGARDLKRDIFQAMRTASPVVLVDNTEGAAKQMCLLAGALRRAWARAPLVSCRPFLQDGAGARLGGCPSSAELIKAMMPNKILSHIEAEFDASAMPASERLTMGDIVSFIDLVLRRLASFKETVCIADPLDKTLHEAVPGMAAALSKHHMGSKELRAGRTQRSLVLRGWRLHRKLAQKSEQLRRVNVAVSVATALTIFLTAALAVNMVSLRFQKLRYSDLIYNVSVAAASKDLEVDFTLTEAIGFVRFALVLLPITAGLLTTLQGHFRLSHRWASVHLAAAQVVSEIYHLLCGVGPYSGGPDQRQTAFMARQDRIVRHLAAAGIHEGDLRGDLEAFPEDAEALERHVEGFVYGQREKHWMRRRLQDALAACGAAGSSSEWVASLMESREPQDYAADVSTETYMETRIHRLRLQYSDWLHCLSTRRLVLNAVLGLCLGGVNLALVVCASLGNDLVDSGLSLCIPVAVGVAALTATLMSTLAPQELIPVLGSALAALNSLDLRWRGSDPATRHSEKTARRLVNTAEGAARAVAAAYSKATVMPEEDDMEGWEAADAGKLAKRSCRSVTASRTASVTATPSDLMSEMGSISDT